MELTKSYRIGEIKTNNKGIKMEIIDYKNAHDILVKFHDGDSNIIHTSYLQFKKGLVKSPYNKSVKGVGYLGVGKYKARENRKSLAQYLVWTGMLDRCYNEKHREKLPSYKDCTVCEEWLNYQNFAKWYDENYYEIEGQRMHLDKDILVKGNKIYSPDTCCFVPQKINLLFIKNNKMRNKDVPIGVLFRSGKYQAHYSNNGKTENSDFFDNPKDAFNAYKIHKENLIKRFAEEYKEYIPQNLYDAMYAYQVEIND